MRAPLVALVAAAPERRSSIVGADGYQARVHVHHGRIRNRRHDAATAGQQQHRHQALHHSSLSARESTCAVKFTNGMTRE
jgi:hypothetical protein